MSDMKCPICNDGKIIAKLDGTYECDNPECSIYNGTHTETFEALIRTRKALEGIKKVVDGFGWGCGNMHLPDYHDGLIIAEIVNEALEQKDVK